MKPVAEATDPVDQRMMRAALALACSRVGQVGARPAVGSVIVRHGRIIGRGATGPDGQPHAETVALAQARARYGDEALHGATAYVTLEPCAHHGRTPPCTDALIGAGIARLVAPFEDPDPRVSGRGFAALRVAGVELAIGVQPDRARAVNRGFLTRIKTGRPRVTLKLAATLDGRIATRTGESRWITGPAARRRVHLMRLRADAVLIGAGTARADDPMLDVRGFGAVPFPPLRVIVDGGLTLPVTGRLARSARDLPVLALHRDDAPDERRAALTDLGVETTSVAARPDGTLDLTAALTLLGDRGVGSVLVEGGGRIAATLLSMELVDELVLFTAGKAIGGDGVAAVAAVGLASLGAAPSFDLVSTEPLGADVLSRWRRRLVTADPSGS